MVTYIFITYLDTIIKAKYFYRYLVEDWYINLDRTRKDGKQIIQISDTETVRYGERKNVRGNTRMFSIVKDPLLMTLYILVVL